MSNDCPVCGDNFETERGMHVHHTQVHGESLSETEIECVICGEMFRTYEPDRRTTCSQECNSKHISKRQSGDGHWNWKGGEVEMECIVCEDKFSVKQGRKNDRVVCSNQCNAEHLSNITGEDRWNYEGGPVSKKCTVCGDIFQTNKADVERRETCSVECRAEKMSGEGHPRWVEDSTSYGHGWERIADEVRNQDNNSCHLCGDVSKNKLPVHHIIPVREFDDEERAHFKENLVTLCRRCHADVEWNWSLKEQIEEFNRDAEKLGV